MFLVMLLFSSVSLPDHPDRIPSTSYPQHIPHPPPSHAILTPSLSLLLQVPDLSANLFRDPSLPTPLLLPAPVFLLLKLPLAPFLKMQCILSCFSRHAENVETIKISSWVKPTLAISNLRKTHKHICNAYYAWTIRLKHLHIRVNAWYPQKCNMCERVRISLAKKQRKKWKEYVDGLGEILSTSKAHKKSRSSVTCEQTL